MHVSIFVNGIRCNSIDVITHFWTTLSLHVLSVSSSSSSATELPLMVESYGLLKDIFPFPRPWTQVIHFLTFIWQMPCTMLSSHRYLGFPCDLSVRDFHLNIFLSVLVWGIFCTWPNQLRCFICWIFKKNICIFYVFENNYWKFVNVSAMIIE